MSYIPAVSADELVSSERIVKQLSQPKFRVRGLVKVEAADLPTVTLGMIQFELDSAALTPRAMRQLVELGKAMQSATLADQRFRIAGHTDARGDEQHNDDLSWQRADAVRDFLVDAYDIASWRLETVGYGERRPKLAQRPEDERNRRVEILNLGRPE